MMIVILSLILVSLSLMAAVALLPVLLKVFLYALVAIGLAIQFAAKKFLIAVPWIISAGGALTFMFYALGKQFFTGADAKFLIEQKLPLRDRQKTLPLLTIELMLEIRKFLAVK